MGDFSQDGLYQCDYWTSHVLQNCSVNVYEGSSMGSGGSGLHLAGAGSGLGSGSGASASLRANLQWVQRNILEKEVRLSICKNSAWCSR